MGPSQHHSMDRHSYQHSCENILQYLKQRALRTHLGPSTITLYSFCTHTNRITAKDHRLDIHIHRHLLHPPLLRPLQSRLQIPRRSQPTHLLQTNRHPQLPPNLHLLLPDLVRRLTRQQILHLQ